MSWLDDNKNFLMGTGALGLGLLIFFQNCSGNFESAGIKSLSSTQSTLAEKCTQNQVCQFVNGIGVKVCSANGTLADCQVTGCFAGYRQENNDCVPTNCTPGASESCADGNKTGNKICKSDGTGYDDCVLNGCAEGFYLAGDQCLTNCTPGTSTMCEDNTGRGMKYCTSDGKGYSICKYRSCLPQFNYNASAQTCTRGGECGSANNQQFTQKPTADLCAWGDVVPNNSVGSYQWQWTCKSGTSGAYCTSWQATQIRCSHYAGYNNDGSRLYVEKLYFLKDQMMSPKECYDSYLQHMNDYRPQTQTHCPTVPNYLAGKTEITFQYSMDDEDQDHLAYFGGYCL